MKKSAFTLIELLVVIAIIAILAALAIPAITGALEKARALNDSNQLSSMGKMFVRYLGDHDDQMPVLAGSGAGATWPQQIYKVTPDYKIFVSPFDKRAVTDGTSSPVSYGINQNVFGTNASDWNSPSALIFMAPQATLSRTSPTFDGIVSTNVAITPGQSCGVYKNNSMTNVLFADWHVLPMNHKTDFADVGSTKGMRRWNPTYVDAQNQ